MRFRFRYMESILTIVCDEGFRGIAEDAVFEARNVIESRISEDPFFGITYEPYHSSGRDHPLIRRMCDSSVVSGVGPMAGVAGAVAVHVAERLKAEGSSMAIVENGGDIALYSEEPVPVGVYADHPVFRNVAFMVESPGITGICSSSRTVGHSVSFGGSSISTVFSDDVVLADCCATALGNLVTDEDSIGEAVETVGSMDGVKGCVACCGGKVAMFGDVPEMVSADCGDAVERTHC